eukprot:COSAG02_NODE_1543_length_12003_cov_16.681536_4_plen_72_part_00
MEARSHPVIFPSQFFNTFKSAPNEAKYRYITLYLNAVLARVAGASRAQEECALASGKQGIDRMNGNCRSSG